MQFTVPSEEANEPAWHLEQLVDPADAENVPKAQREELVAPTLADWPFAFDAYLPAGTWTQLAWKLAVEKKYPGAQAGVITTKPFPPFPFEEVAVDVPGNPPKAMPCW